MGYQVKNQLARRALFGLIPGALAACALPAWAKPRWYRISAKPCTLDHYGRAEVMLETWQTPHGQMAIGRWPEMTDAETEREVRSIAPHLLTKTG